MQTTANFNITYKIFYVLSELSLHLFYKQFMVASLTDYIQYV